MNRDAKTRRSSTTPFACLLALLTMSGVLHAGDREPGVSVLTLRSRAVVRDEARLDDVLDFSQADATLAATLAKLPVPLNTPIGNGVRVERDTVLSILREANVNLARVLLRGGLFCDIEVETPQVVADESTEGADELANGQTLAALLRRALQERLADLGGALEFDFGRASRELLGLSSPAYEFAIRIPHDVSVGMNEIPVDVLRDGAPQRSATVNVRVRLLRKTLVASRPINQGAVIRRDALDYATRVFNDGPPPPAPTAEEVVGQEARRYIAAGAEIRLADVKVSEMVKRSRPVTVISGGAVGLRLTGVALDSGGIGETVRVRIGDTRRDRREVRGVVSGMATVRLAEDGR